MLDLFTQFVRRQVSSDLWKAAFLHIRDDTFADLKASDHSLVLEGYSLQAETNILSRALCIVHRETVGKYRYTGLRAE